MAAARRYIAAAPREIKNLAIRPWPPSRGTRGGSRPSNYIFRARSRGAAGGECVTIPFRLGMGGRCMICRVLIEMMLGFLLGDDVGIPSWR